MQAALCSLHRPTCSLKHPALSRGPCIGTVWCLSCREPSVAPCVATCCARAARVLHPCLAGTAATRSLHPRPAVPAAARLRSRCGAPPPQQPRPRPCCGAQPRPPAKGPRHEGVALRLRARLPRPMAQRPPSGAGSAAGALQLKLPLPDEITTSHRGAPFAWPRRPRPSQVPLPDRPQAGGGRGRRQRRGPQLAAHTCCASRSRGKTRGHSHSVSECRFVLDAFLLL